MSARDGGRVTLTTGIIRWWWNIYAFIILLLYGGRTAPAATRDSRFYCCDELRPTRRTFCKAYRNPAHPRLKSLPHPFKLSSSLTNHFFDRFLPLSFSFFIFYSSYPAPRWITVPVICGPSIFQPMFADLRQAQAQIKVTGTWIHLVNSVLIDFYRW